MRSFFYLKKILLREFLNAILLKKITFILGSLLVASSGNTQTIFTEDFQTNTDLVVSGWTLYNDGFTPNGYQEIFPDAWAVVEWAEESPNIAAASTSSLIEGLAADRWLVSPAISIPSNASLATLKFKARCMDVAPRQDGFTLKISTTNTNKASFTTTLLTVDNAPNMMLSDIPLTEIDLSPFVGQTIYLAWINNFLQGNILNIDDIVVTKGALATTSFETTSFALAPNPTKNRISISSSNKAMLTNLVFTDANGRIVKTLTSQNSTQIVVDITDLELGVYFVKLDSNEGETIKKIIKN